jgi:UDP-N-acetylmuramoyl-L-alanyl-D-glutamate--2,6-diaminopimelate ligase
MTNVTNDKGRPSEMTVPDVALPLRDLLNSLRLDYRWIHAPGEPDAASIEITHLSHENGDAQPGGLHFCIRGSSYDGHDYAQDAVGAGAVALVCAYHVENLPVPQLLVDNVRRAMAQIACSFYSHPSEKLNVVGITGTNGKTSTAYMVRDILRCLGVAALTYGTLSGQRTTPEAIVFQRRLAEAVATKVDTVVTEVTSHSLVQHRVGGTTFEIAAFTNLSQDHLDYHKTMEAYFTAKSKLFEESVSRRCVVNVSTEWGARLASMIDPARLHSFDPQEVAVSSLSPRGADIVWRGYPVHLPVSPRFLVDNAVMAAEIAVALDHEPAKIATCLEHIAGVRGRYELIDVGQPFVAIIDFGHTPDAIEAVLRNTREIYPDSNITIVFGCGGDRDRDKRRLMGAIAASMADRVVLTSDNPRSESAVDILEEIREGIPAESRSDVNIVPERAAGIALAIDVIREGDVVVVAGKGHEQYQEIDGKRYPFQDHQVVRAEAIRWLEKHSNSNREET